MGGPWNLDLSFSSLIKNYRTMQSRLVQQVKALASNYCSVNAGSFILLQFEMAQVTQVGESISNLIGQVNKVVSNAISNQKVQ
jgi:hypothetical protein